MVIVADQKAPSTEVLSCSSPCSGLRRSPVNQTVRTVISKRARVRTSFFFAKLTLKLQAPFGGSRLRRSNYFNTLSFSEKLDQPWPQEVTSLDPLRGCGIL